MNLLQPPAGAHLTALGLSKGQNPWPNCADFTVAARCLTAYASVLPALIDGPWLTGLVLVDRSPLRHPPAAPPPPFPPPSPPVVPPVLLPGLFVQVLPASHLSRQCPRSWHAQRCWEGKPHDLSTVKQER